MYIVMIHNYMYVLNFSSSQVKPPDAEPWQQFLSETNWVLTEPLFVGYIKRVTAILSEEDITNHLNLSTNKSVSLLMNLSHANLVLSTLYKSSPHCNQLCLHKVIAEDLLFVECCVKFICTMLKLSGM